MTNLNKFHEFLLVKILDILYIFLAVGMFLSFKI